MASAIGCSLPASTAAAIRSTSSAANAVGSDHVDHAHLPGRHRAGLVEHDRVDGSRVLQHLGALDQQTRVGLHGRCRRAAPSAWPDPSAHGQAMINTDTAGANASAQ